MRRSLACNGRARPIRGLASRDDDGSPLLQGVASVGGFGRDVRGVQPVPATGPAPARKAAPTRAFTGGSADRSLSPLPSTPPATGREWIGAGRGGGNPWGPLVAHHCQSSFHRGPCLQQPLGCAPRHDGLARGFREESDGKTGPSAAAHPADGQSGLRRRSLPVPHGATRGHRPRGLSEAAAPTAVVTPRSSRGPRHTAGRSR